jgi:hypothetical protein
VPGGYLVVVRGDIPRQHESELDEFYRREHFPALLSVPGVIAARRFKAVRGDGPKVMVTVRLDHLGVVESEGYKKKSSSPWREKVTSYYTTRSRSIYEEIAGFRHMQHRELKSPFAWVTNQDVAPEYESEFNEWCDKEHIPLLLQIPGWLGVERLRRVQGSSPKYLTFHEVEGSRTLERKELERASRTKWSRRVQPHFKNYSSTLYKQLYGLESY